MDGVAAVLHAMEYNRAGQHGLAAANGVGRG